MPGAWQRYYTKWRTATQEVLDPCLLELVPQLARLTPPASVIDKWHYSAFAGQRTILELRRRQADCLIITGAETDVCVLATVLGAVDAGFRVIVVKDALCSSSDQGHDALLELYTKRFSEQIEVSDASTILSAWK